MQTRTRGAGLPTLFLGLIFTAGLHADWPTLHGNVRHDGFADVRVEGPYQPAWAREFEGERLGTAMEAIVGTGRVFLATHSGNLYALEAESGKPAWRFSAWGPFLQSPVLAEDRVVAGSMDGRLYALATHSGRLLWTRWVGEGGFAASPVVDSKSVYLGSRTGVFVAVDLATGRLQWRTDLGAVIRQTAAIEGSRVFVTAEDLRVRCLDARTGRVLWRSVPLPGQSARDYYPIVVNRAGQSFVVVRTSPLANMAQRIARDRGVLARNAGADDSDWRKLDAWIKSDAARGSPELWDREQAAIRGHLDSEPAARTFFVLDATTGEEAIGAPVLWVGGCQGVGAMPARTADSRLLVFHRTAYGNWNHGVAPLVGLGLLDLITSRILPLFHEQGTQPPWNTFWGTADESQNFVIAGQTVLIVHQGTLSAFDLNSHRLSRLWGERDTYGGFKSPAWARNEWHGPARGGVSLDDQGRIYWLTGSRLLCLIPGKEEQAPRIETIRNVDVPGHSAPELPGSRPRDVRRRLEAVVREVLSRRWAPLFVEPGLAGRQFFFDQSGDVFEALAWAYPHLSRGLRREVRRHLAAEWGKHPPFTSQSSYPLSEGSPRENYPVPDALRTRTGIDRPFHPFGNLHVIQFYAKQCEETARVRESWPQIQAAFRDFARAGWMLDPDRGDLWANRYTASLFAAAELADQMGDAAMSSECRVLAEQALDKLAAWWRRAADQLAQPSTFEGSRELDPFIGQGTALSFSVAPHRHKIALFKDLTPDLAARLRLRDPSLRDRKALVLSRFDQLHATWWLAAEERQVHFGENLLDPPDLAMDAFRAHVALEQMPTQADRARRIDIPWCRADLFQIIKLALALEAERASIKTLSTNI